jgi:protein-S-isoprenylcysteine O-methyltransferase Ste14
MKHYEDTCTRLLDYRPPRIAMALLTSASVLQLAWPMGPLNLPFLAIAGIALCIAGFGIMIRAWWLFRQVGTAICPTATTTFFIANDVYSVTRNPMYLGMIFILLGIAALVDSWYFYVTAGVYALILNHVFCPYEERKLGQQFGDDYAAYAARVRRWL